MKRAACTLVLLLVAQAQAHSEPTPASLCTKPTPPANAQQYTIDLANASALGKTRYGTRDEVQIVFTNKNPFLFDYRFTLKEDVVTEPALEAFLRLFQTVPAPAIPLPAANTTAPTAGAAAVDTPTPCDTALLNAERSLHQTETDLLSRFTDLKLRTERIALLFQQLKGTIDPQEKILNDPTQPCTALVQAAVTTSTAIDSALKPRVAGSLGEELEQFATKLGDFKVALGQGVGLPRTLLLGLRTVGCTASEIHGLDDQLAKYDKTITVLQESLKAENPQGLAKAAADFDKAAKEAQAKSKGIADVLKRPENFQETRIVGDFDDVTIVTITAERKKREESTFPSSPYLVKKLRFGGRARFALAAGAAFSTLNQTDFGAIQGVERTPEGEPILTDNKPNLTRVVGIKDEADQRVTPMIALHTRIAEGKGVVSGYHATFGFAGNVANNGVNLEYLAGVSLSFAEERFFITLGAYNGRVEELQKGFYEGLALPAAITEDPVIRGRDWDFGFALTYKFR